MTAQESIDAQKICNAALVFSQAVDVLCALEGMKAFNREREENGETLAYDEEAFDKLRQRVGWSSAKAILREGL